MLKIATAVVGAALVAGAITGFPRFQLIEPVSAGSMPGRALPAPACPQRGWPYNHCGLQAVNGGGPMIRLVTTDKLR